jgi:hypothetical protein
MWVVEWLQVRGNRKDKGSGLLDSTNDSHEELQKEVDITSSIAQEKAQEEVHHETARNLKKLQDTGWKMNVVVRELATSTNTRGWHTDERSSVL